MNEQTRLNIFKTRFKVGYNLDLTDEELKEFKPTNATWFCVLLLVGAGMILVGVISGASTSEWPMAGALYASCHRGGCFNFFAYNLIFIVIGIAIFLICIFSGKKT